jgi:hypothetical protein
MGTVTFNNDGSISMDAGNPLVLDDNSNGEPTQAPSTPTGNGTGYFVQQQADASGIFGSIQQALNYALSRDQNQQAMASQQTAGAIQVQQDQSKQRGLIILAVAVVAGLWVWKRG